LTRPPNCFLIRVLAVSPKEALVRSSKSILVVLWLLASPPWAIGSKEGDKSGSVRPKEVPEVFAGLSFRSIGPFRGGRSVAVRGVRGEPLTFYFGGTGGGVFKTTDGGATWDPISDKFFKSGSVGAIDVADSDPNVVYAGMGESPIRGNLSSGDGVYKSTDAGATWANVGLRSTYQISRVRIHPKNPEIVYVAALGHAWGPNEDRGIFRTTDGGKSWKKVLYVDEKTGASDLGMDPTNPRILYAAFWQVYRKPWTLESGGVGSGLYKSTDGGDTWKKLSGGLPDGVVGRIGVAVSPARPRRVYAIVEAAKGGVYRSEDGGEKWTLVSGEHKLVERAWYYNWIYADTRDADAVYVPNVSFHKSIDGGKTFSTVRVPHGDNHDLWIDPDDPNRMILGNDGGATISMNGGRTWSTQDNQPTAQFYRVAIDQRIPYRVYGAQQDNSTVAISSASRSAGIEPTDWHAVGGGESGWIAPNPKDPDIVYAGGYGGSITRYDHRTGETREITAWPQPIDGQATRDLKYRFQWNAPLLLSPHDPSVLYHAAHILLRSRDEGQTWEEISPDLTRNDPAKQGYSGGPIVHEVTGVEVYDTIFTVVESPHDAQTIWAGTDDGLVQLTRDGGRSWQNVTPKGIPEWIRINSLEVSPLDPATAYVAATMYQFDDQRPYVYKTSDYGKSWTKIVSGIPDGAFTRVVREDPARRGLLYAGTETGLYVSFDDGGSWRAFQRNLPVVPISDLAVAGSDLVVATQGRAFWILDDLTPLRLWNEGLPSEAVHLFPPRPTIRLSTDGDQGDGEPLPNRGENAPRGVVIDYFLKEKPKDDQEVSIQILSGETVLRSFSSKKKPGSEDEHPADADDAKRDKPLEVSAGLNRFVWDLRMIEPVLISPRYTFGDTPPFGARVAPGTYTVRLKVGTRVLEEKAEVRPLSTLKVSAAELKEQFDLLAALEGDLSAAHETVRSIQDAKSQIKGIVERADKIGKGGKLSELAKPLTEKLSAVEDKLFNPNLKADEDSLLYTPRLDFQFAALAGVVASADARPTAAALKRYAELRKQLDDILQDLRRVLDQELAAFNKAVRDQDVPPVVFIPREKHDPFESRVLKTP
jgi:photosystem II stability/assembly factor-like uncharacterized protein